MFSDLFNFQFSSPFIFRPLRLTKRNIKLVFRWIFRHVSLIFRLTTRLVLNLLTGTRMWFVMFIRLLLFVVALLPAFIQMIFWWAFNFKVHKNIPYRDLSRNSLDVYTPRKKQGVALCPVVVYLTGGAWTIGYKAWGALLGKVLSDSGVTFVSVDYRNFPQADVMEMLDDIDNALDWVFSNIHQFHGDPTKVFLVGQSAGAHLGSLLLLQKITQHEIIDHNHEVYVHRPWKIKQLRGYIGVSGAYDLVELAEHFHSRGLDRRLLTKIMCGDLDLTSPTRIVMSDEFTDSHASQFPAVAIIHGSADFSVSYHNALKFAEALISRGKPVQVLTYDGWTHTDPLLEGPFGGDQRLCQDILNFIQQQIELKTDDLKVPARHTRGMCPKFLIALARYVNPF